MSEATIRVLVADDHAMVREGIRHVLEREPGFAVVGEATNGAEVLPLAEPHRPDVAVLDISMPGETGLQVAGAAAPGAAPRSASSSSACTTTPSTCSRACAPARTATCSRTRPRTELRRAIRTVQGGRGLLSARRSRAGSPPPYAASSSARARTGDLDALTGREREVLRGIVRGQTNKEIAAELGISHRTVETHRESLMRKLRHPHGRGPHPVRAGGGAGRRLVTRHINRTPDPIRGHFEAQSQDGHRHAEPGRTGDARSGRAVSARAVRRPRDHPASGPELARPVHRPPADPAGAGALRTRSAADRRSSPTPRRRAAGWSSGSTASHRRPRPTASTSPSAM